MFGKSVISIELTIKGRQQKVLPPFPIIEERGIFHD